MEIQVSGFASRGDLESEIKRLEDKAGVSIVGTGEELSRLGLSYRTNVYGVPCVESDREESEENKEEYVPVFRGPVQPFGLDSQRRTPEGKIITDESGEDLLLNEQNNTEPPATPEGDEGN